MHSPRTLLFALICLVVSPLVSFGAQDTTFTFNLNASYTTSAGVYQPDGTLVRTLWRKVAHGPDPVTRTWNGRDDGGNLMPAGNYQIKVLYHNVQYVFDGMIGNTSSPSSGLSVFHGNMFIHNLAIIGNSAFFANGLNEGRQTMHYFNTATPGEQIDIGHKDYYVGFDQVAADENKVYFACRNGGFFPPDWPPLNKPEGDGYHTFVVAFSTTFNSVSGVFDAIPFPSPHGTNLNTNRPPGVWDDQDHATYWPGVIDVDTDYWPYDIGVNHKAPTGIAVQRAGQGNGNVLAVSHGGLNIVRLFNKGTGAPLGSIAVANPRGLAMSPDGSLWVISGATVQKFQGPPLNGGIIGGGMEGGEEGGLTLGATASEDLDLPVSIVVGPAGQLIVADGGTNQQLKTFTSAGVPLPAFTQGLEGGYAVHGPGVQSNKWGFHVNRGIVIDHTPLALQSDGTVWTLWLGDGAAKRLLHYGNYLTGGLTQLPPTIMYFGLNGTSTVDAHDPRRVIGDGFLEFEVDYNADILQGWTLKKNWAAGLEPRYFNDVGGYPGLRNMITFVPGQSYGTTTGNGRTYATLSDFSNGRSEIVELPEGNGTFLRRTGQFLPQGKRYPGVGSEGLEDMDWGKDGGLIYHEIIGDRVYWYFGILSGFSSQGNPNWTWTQTLDRPSAPASDLDPIPGSNATVPSRYPITSSNVLVSYDPQSEDYIIPPIGGGQRVDQLGWHLGGMKLGVFPASDRWLWKVSPTIQDTDVDGLGSFLVEHNPNGTTRPFAGTVAMANGRNIIYGYHGEFYHAAGNASQWMHFYDDGLFVGQFGTPYDPNHEVSGSGAVPGSTALQYFSSMVAVDQNNMEAAPGTGETYIWGNTNSSHFGAFRWHVIGANQIQEAVGTVALGGTINLNPVPPTYPVGLKAAPGNGQIALSWVSAPPPSSNYVLKVSRTSFGTPIQTASGASGTSHTFTGLTNDSSTSPLAPYYIRIGGGSATAANEVIAYPFNRIGRCGQQVGGPAYPWQVDSSAPEQNRPSVTGISPVVGNTALTSVGSKGYVIYGWNFNKGERIDVSNLSDDFHANLSPSGWTTVTNSAHYKFYIDGEIGAIGGAIRVDDVERSGSINIVVPPGDTAVHYLTVFSPAIGQSNTENPVWEVKLTSDVDPMTPAAIYSISGVGKYNRIHQFEFIGNVTLTMTKPEQDVSQYIAALGAIFLD